MKAQDLMIGDWVIHHNNGCIDAMNDTASYDENIQIQQDDFDLDECFFGRLSPIPLTPDILEKNGFKPFKVKDTDSTEVIGKWWGMSGSVMVKQYSLTHIGKVFSVKGNYSRIGNIRYVHELQHALRLCGIEKEIVL